MLTTSPFAQAKWKGVHQFLSFSFTRAPASASAEDGSESMQRQTVCDEQSGALVEARKGSDVERRPAERVLREVSALRHPQINRVGQRESASSSMRASLALHIFAVADEGLDVVEIGLEARQKQWQPLVLLPGSTLRSVWRRKRGNAHIK